MTVLLFCALIMGKPTVHVHHQCACEPGHGIQVKKALPINFATAPNTLVVTEIMQNPKAVSDSNGEWFEVFNPTQATINLNGWTIRDNDNDSHAITTDVFIASGAYAVLGRNANSGQNGGVSVDYQYSGFTLANGADEVVLVRPDTSVADTVEYDGGSQWPDPNGKSMVLSSAADDNNVGANWSAAVDLISGSSDYGTPGSGPDTVAPADLVITEIMQNPDTVSDANGEWFEIYNPGSSDVDLNGWTIRDNGIDSHAITTSVIAPAGDYIVLGRNANSAANGGVTVDYQYSGFSLANGDDEIVLVRPDSSVADEVAYDGGPQWPDPTGASMALSSPGDDNNTGSNWSESTAFITGASGDKGTPGQANGGGSTAVENLAITEIMQNPSAVSDANGEWFEVFNPGSSDVNMQGWTIRDNDIDSHVIASSLVVPAGGYAVLGINSASAANGGVTVDYQYSGFLLANGADEVVLVRPDATIADEALYDGGSQWPDPTGASMELNSASNDNNVGANWSAATEFITGTSGDKGTPGSGPDGGASGVNLVITEIMQNPNVVADGSGEWFEVFNPGPGTVNLNGWTIRDNDTDSHAVTVDVTIASGAYAVLGNNANASTNGGVTVDYQYSGLFLANGADEVVLVRPDASVADEVLYDGGSLWPDPTGASMELNSASNDNNVGANWSAATAFITGTSGDKGTPGSGPDGGTGGPTGNRAPVVSAGADQSAFLDGASVTVSLNGSASDPDGDSISPAWTLSAGVAANVTIANVNQAQTTADITAVGTYTFQLSAADAEFTTVDSMTVTVALRPAPGAYQVYYGNLHTHSSYSDGNQNGGSTYDGAAAAFRYARDLADSMDWMVLSDHNHTAAGMAYANYAAGVAEAATVTGETTDFIALYGSEWGTISTGGHVVYTDNQLWGWEAGSYDVFVAKGDYNALFSQVVAAGTFAHLCHPQSSQFSGLFSSAYNASWDNAISLTAVRSGPAFATETDYSGGSTWSYQGLYENLLLKGYKLGPGADLDTHNANWGKASGQRTAILATSLTRANVLDALKAGRTFATDDRNLAIDFVGDLGGVDYTLAETISSTISGTVAFSVTVTDVDGESLTNIRLLQGAVGGSVITEAATSSSSVLSHSYATNATGTHFFYVEVNQADGDQAWSAPIWITVN